MFARIDSRPAGNRRANSWKILATTIIVSLLLASPFSGTAHASISALCYVNAAAVGTNNGGSWTNAYTSLQSAVQDVSCAEIWVAAGVYKPGASRSDSFNVLPLVAVYGGFAGTETLRTQRDWSTNVTILSGDIDNNDVNLDGNHIDETAANITGNNSYHVVLMDGTGASIINASTVLDGFTITGGQATSTSDPDGWGGGLYCNGKGATHACSPTLTNLAFSGNTAGVAGGALSDDGDTGGLSSPKLTNVSFTGNTASSAGGGDGGAIFNGGNASPTLTNVTFSANTANDSGGAIYNDPAGGTSSPFLTNVTFTGNRATHNHGGAMVNIASTGTSSPTLTDVTFSGNHADGGRGGAMLNVTETGTSSPTLTNVTLDSNTADEGGAIFDWGLNGGSAGTASPKLTNVTFTGNVGTTDGGAMADFAEGGITNPNLVNVTFNANHSNGSGGAIFNYANNGGVSSPLLTNVTFEGNSADQGGAMYDAAAGGSSEPVLSSAILYADTASTSGPEIYNNINAGPDIQDSLVQGSGGSGVLWDITLGSDSGGNIDSDPMLGPLQNNGGFTNTMALAAGSPAIDAGLDFSCPATDQRGVTRPQGPHCDIGAYESLGDHVRVYASGSPQGSYLIPHTWAQQDGYAGVNSGPAEAVNLEGSVVSSIRVIYAGSSYSEMMGYPDNATTDFWFPFYNNVAFSSQFRVSNLGGTSTTITVDLGGSTIDSFTLGAGAAVRKSYPGQNGGPMHVSSSGGTPILSTIRVLFGGTSYSEMMGSPINYATDFYFPWYNNVAMDSQFRVSNLGGTPTTITVSLAGSPIDSFTLPAGAAIRKNYAGQNNGPMHVSSSVTPILSTIRVLYAGSSYSEMMGYPNASTPDFWFPWYDNVGAGTQFRVSNLGGSPTTITVSLGGIAIDSFLLAANSAVRKSYAGKNTGGFHVTSSVTPILATERILYGATSFYELTGFPTYLMTSTQYFPWYNDAAFDSQMRIAVP